MGGSQRLLEDQEEGGEAVLMMIYKLDWIAYGGSIVDIVCVG
jgi:hypothetical protein